MMKSLTMLRTSAAAIAAATVLSSGLASAQEVDPSTTVAAPVDTATPVSTPEPVASEPTVTDPLSPATDTPVATTSEPAPVAATTTRRTATRSPAVATPRAATPNTSNASTPTAAPEPAATDVSVTDPLATPVPPLAVEEAAPAPAPVDASNDDLLPVAVGAGAGLLAMLGLGMAMRRRKVTRAEPMVADQPRIARTVVDESATVTTTPTAHPRPAFAFGNQAPAAAVAAPMVATGGNRIERALKGPTPDNPFLSLKKRLKRAAFFEQRERQLRDGTGTHVSPMAGLPERLVDKLKAATRPQAAPRYQWA